MLVCDCNKALLRAVRVKPESCLAVAASPLVQRLSG